MIPGDPLLLPEHCPPATSSPVEEGWPGAAGRECEPERDALAGADEPYQFSYFLKPIRNIFPRTQVGLRLVYNFIHDGAFSKPTEALRRIRDAGEARSFKATEFDYVTFSGVFLRRDGKCLKRHSGLLCLDFDHLDDPVGLKKALIRDKYFETQLAFISPSGHGLKWVIPIRVSSQFPHERWFSTVRNYVQQAYKVAVDPSGRDVARACFLPHDPEAYIKPSLLL